jgi:hypothetical protein
MKISIKTKDIELNYEDEYSKIEIYTVQNINDLIEKIHQKKHKCEYCNNQSGLVIENKIKEPTIFGVPNKLTGDPVLPPNNIFLGGVQYTNSTKKEE